MLLHVTTDRTRIDFARVYAGLNADFGGPQGIPRDLFDRAMNNSLCFAGLLDNETIAFARVISDYATFAHLMDVYVARDYRGMGYATQLLEGVFACPALHGVRRFTLATRDAHPLYARFGFHAPAMPETLMERYDPGSLPPPHP